MESAPSARRGPRCTRGTATRSWRRAPRTTVATVRPSAADERARSVSSGSTVAESATRWNSPLKRGRAVLESAVMRYEPRLRPATAWISSRITVRTWPQRSCARDGRRSTAGCRLSGVVTRISGGRTGECAAGPTAGVSPLRDMDAGSRPRTLEASCAPSSAQRAPSGCGATSLLSAFSGAHVDHPDGAGRPTHRSASRSSANRASPPASCRCPSAPSRAGAHSAAMRGHACACTAVGAP